MAYKDGSRIRGGKNYRQHQGFKKFIRERDNYTCRLCGKYGFVVDHIIPYAISHETKPDGVRVLCYSCNLKLRRVRKDANPWKHLEDWFADLDKQLNHKEQCEPDQ